MGDGLFKNLAMNPRDFTAGTAVRALNPDVPELGGAGQGQTITPRHIITAGPAAEREAELREAVLADVRARGWLALYGATARATGRTLGEPDLIVCADGSRVFFVELKTRTGKLSSDQFAVHHHLKSLGHTPLVIRSIEEFRSAVA